MDLKDRLEAAKARKAAAEAALSETDQEEIATRAELARIEEEVRAAESKKLDLDMDRRMDLAREALPDVKLRGVVVREFPDQSFIVRYSSHAYKAFLESLRRAQTAENQGKKADFTTFRVQFALSTVVDWNGETDFTGTNSERTTRLRKLLLEHEGLTVNINNAGAALAGIDAEERKSEA